MVQCSEGADNEIEGGKVKGPSPRERRLETIAPNFILVGGCV